MKVSELIAQLQKMVELNPEVANLEIYNSPSNTEEIKLTEVYYAGGIPSQDGYNNVNYFTKDFDEAKHYNFDELELCVVLTNTTNDDFSNKFIEEEPSDDWYVENFNEMLVFEDYDDGEDDEDADDDKSENHL